MMKQFSIILLLLLFGSAFGDDDHQLPTDHDDQHLHESQIPPPNQQPSQEEIKTMLTNVFEQMDKNSDKNVEIEELKLWLDKIHGNLINENVQQQWSYYNPPVQEVHSWDSYDPVKEEALTWDHYTNLTYTEEVIKAHKDNVNVDDVKTEDPHFRTYYMMIKRAEKRWKACDKNNDSVLIKDEFKYFLHPEESEQTKHILVEEAMQDMDSSGNDEISLEEYIKHMTDVSPEEDRKDPNFLTNHQSQFETYLDKNKDGNLCKTELSEWLIPSYDRHEAEAGRMIQAVDEDLDQKLSQDEMLKHSYNFYGLIPAEMWRQHAETTTPGSHDEF